MPRLYSITDAGRKAYEGQSTKVPLECRRVLGLLGQETDPRDIQPKLGLSESGLGEILQELERTGLVKSVEAAPSKSDLDFTGSFNIAEIQAAQEEVRKQLDFTGKLKAEDLRAAQQKKK